jgi:galactokinase
LWSYTKDKGAKEIEPMKQSFRTPSLASCYPQIFQEAFNLDEFVEIEPFSRRLMMNFMGNFLDPPGSMVLMHPLPLGMSLFFYPTSNQSIDFYNLEQQEYYSYGFGLYRSPMPTDAGHWSYGLWQVLHRFALQGVALKGMQVLIVGLTALAKVLGSYAAMQIELTRVLQVYIQENRLMLSFERRVDQLELIHFVGQSLAEDPYQVGHWFELYTPVLLLEPDKLLFSNAKTFEPQSVEMQVPGTFWLVYVSGLESDLASMLQESQVLHDLVLYQLAQLGCPHQRLIDVGIQELGNYAHQLSQRAYYFAKYMIEENLRVAMMVLALGSKEPGEVVELMEASTQGIRQYYALEPARLAKVYEDLYALAGVSALRLASMRGGVFSLFSHDDVALERSLACLAKVYAKEGIFALSYYLLGNKDTLAPCKPLGDG